MSPFTETELIKDHEARLRALENANAKNTFFFSLIGSAVAGLVMHVVFHALK